MADSDIRKYFERLPFWEKLTGEEREYIIRNTGFRRFTRGSMVSDYDRVCLAITIGIVELHTMGDDGRDIILDEIEAGDSGVMNASVLFKYLRDELYATAKTDCGLATIDVDSFKKLVDSNIYVRCFWYEIAAKSFSHAMHSIRSALLVSIDRRLAGYIVDECEKCNSFTIYTTKEEIANRINSVREVVARMLTKFKDAGLITTSRGVLTVLNMDEVRRIAER